MAAVQRAHGGCHRCARLSTRRTPAVAATPSAGTATALATPPPTATAAPAAAPAAPRAYARWAALGVPREPLRWHAAQDAAPQGRALGKCHEVRVPVALVAAWLKWLLGDGARWVTQLTLGGVCVGCPACDHCAQLVHV
jgi:hypothetical protein